jgi:hypothetical protein
MRLRVALAALTLALGVAPLLRAQPAGNLPPPRTSSLSWVRMAGAEECVGTQQLARAVEDRLGRTVFVSAAEADVSVEGHIEPQPKGWRAVITLRDAKGTLLGTRELATEKPSCDALREQLALVIAVMIDPDAGSRPKPGPSANASAAGTTPPIYIIQHEQVVVAEKPKGPTWRFDGGAGITTGVGLMPAPHAGIHVGGIITPPFPLPAPWAVGLEGYGSVYLDTEASAERGASAVFSLISVGSSLCPVQLFGGWGSFSVCGGGQLGALRVRGKGFDAAREELYGLVNLASGVRLSVFLLKPIVLRLSVDSVLPLVRDRFSYIGQDGQQHELFRAWPLTISGAGGLGVQFP